MCVWIDLITHSGYATILRFFFSVRLVKLVIPTHTKQRAPRRSTPGAARFTPSDRIVGMRSDLTIETRLLYTSDVVESENKTFLLREHILLWLHGGSTWLDVFMHATTLTLLLRTDTDIHATAVCKLRIPHTTSTRASTLSGSPNAVLRVEITGD